MIQRKQQCTHLISAKVRQEAAEGGWRGGVSGKQVSDMSHEPGAEGAAAHFQYLLQLLLCRSLHMSINRRYLHLWRSVVQGTNAF